VTVVVGAVGIAEVYIGDVRVPGWLLIAVPVAALSIAQFLAFHDLRVQSAVVSAEDRRIVFKNRLHHQIDSWYERDPDTHSGLEDEWAAQTREFLRDSLGDGEANTFARNVWRRDDVLDRADAWNGVRYLEDRLLGRADSVPLRPGFDAERWAPQ
jgi:hypothetical protein